LFAAGFRGAHDGLVVPAANPSLPPLIKMHCQFSAKSRFQSIELLAGGVLLSWIDGPTFVGFRSLGCC